MTAADVGGFYVGVGPVLEYAALAASDLLADATPPTETPDGDPVAMPDPEPIADPGSSPFKQHRDQSPDTKDVTDADLVHALHDSGYTQREMATLLLGEIETIMEGRKRAADRQKQSVDTSSNGNGQSAATGNRGDRAAQLGWR